MSKQSARAREILEGKTATISGFSALVLVAAAANQAKAARAAIVQGVEVQKNTEVITELVAALHELEVEFGFPLVVRLLELEE